MSVASPSFAAVDGLVGDRTTFIRQYLNNVKNVDGVLSRKVYADGNEMSLTDYFVALSAAAAAGGHGENVAQNVHEISHLLNVVVSCEFSDAMYFIAKFVDGFSKKCKSEYDAPFGCFEHLNERILMPTHRLVLRMVRTLVSLLECSKSVVSSKRDVFNVLLSWSSYLDDNFRGHIRFLSELDTNARRLKMLKDNLTLANYHNNLNSIETIILQIQKRLERFSIKNCRSLEDQKTFQNDTDKNMIDINLEQLKLVTYNDSDTYDLLVVKYKRLHLLTDVTSSTQADKYPFFVKEIKCESGIPRILANMMPYVNAKKIRVVGVGKTKSLLQLCKNYCNGSIDHNTNIDVLLKNEKILIEIVTKLIISLTLKTLDHITEDNNNVTDKNESCKDLLNVFDKFITEITSDGQSLYLINNMIILQNKLWFICNLRKSFNEINQNKINEVINELRTFNINNAIISVDLPNVDSELREERILKCLLSSLASDLIYIALHPALSNLFWERMGFVSSSQISKYVVDFGILDTNVKDNQVMCDKVTRISKELARIKIQMNKCLQIIDDGDAYRKLFNLLASKNYRIFKCFTTYKKRWKNVMNIIVDVIVNKKYEDNVDLERILLAIIYNMDNQDLFDIRLKKIVDDKHIESLINFHHEINNLVEVYSQIACPLDDYESKNNLISSKLSNIIVNNKIRNNLSKSPELKPLRSYINYFTYYSRFVATIVINEHTSVMKESNFNIKMYWNGTAKTIDEIYNNYKMYAFEIQDGYDYMTVFVKWIIAVVYSKMFDVLNAIVINKCKPEDEILLSLTKSLNSFSQLELIKFAARPVEDITVMFVDVIDSFDNRNVDVLKVYQIKLENELIYLGVPQYTLLETLTNLSLDERIYKLCNAIVYLKSLYGDFERLKYSNILYEVGSIFNIANPFMFGRGDVLVYDGNEKSIRINEVVTKEFYDSTNT